MLNVSRWPPAWEMVVHLAVAGDAFDDVLLYAVLFPHEMSSMRSGTESCQFLRIILRTLQEAIYHAQKSWQEARDRGQSRWKTNGQAHTLYLPNHKSEL